jgi:hypothetical protein
MPEYLTLLGEDGEDAVRDGGDSFVDKKREGRIVPPHKISLRKRLKHCFNLNPYLYSTEK